MHNMENEIPKSKRINSNPIIYNVVREIGTDKILEVTEINIKTDKKEIKFQKPEYKKLLEKLKLK